MNFIKKVEIKKLDLIWEVKKRKSRQKKNLLKMKKILIFVLIILILAGIIGYFIILKFGEEIGKEIEKPKMRKVLLYYYNPEKDKDEKGNIKCSRDGLVPIEREIPITKTPIQDTINLLLKGKENLTEKEKSQGITTEYPLESFKLKSANLKPDGTLILEFEDPLNKSGGGSCRVGILWFQIEATAKQFSEVKKVQFLPEELFQP